MAKTEPDNENENGLRLSKLKWKVRMSGQYTTELNWVASTEDNTITITSATKTTRINAMDHFREFAKANRIKFYIFTDVK